MNRESGAPFPRYRVRDGVAQIELRAKNGYTHRFRVDEKTIPFLRKCWPFEVSTGGKRKKIIKRAGKKKFPLHTVWLMRKHKLRSRWDFSRNPKCRNHDWLDWTRGNIFVPKVNRKSENRREAWLSNHLTDTAKDLLYARACGMSQSIPSDDPEIVSIFQNAARMPACRVRPSKHGPDSPPKDDDE
jgi:hypothetical protein